MKTFILLIATLTVINGRRIYNPDDTDPSACEIFDLHKFIDSTDIDVGHIDEIYSDQSIIRIYKDTNLIFPTTEGFTRRSLPSKFTIEFVYNLKFEPSCEWNLIYLTDCDRKEIFSVSLDLEKKLVTVSFTDPYGNCVKSIFVDSNVSLLYYLLNNFFNNKLLSRCPLHVAVKWLLKLLLTKSLFTLIIKH